jgi:hypoxanthine phosphoribosyltransferase
MDILTIFFGIVGATGTIGTIYYGRKSSHLNRELKRIPWSDLKSASRELRKEINRKFKPDIVFSPCRRGVTIANLVFDVGENVILYVGIREDLREKDFYFSGNAWKEDYAVVETKKYEHYIPKGMLKERDINLLILDDFAMSGSSLEKIKDFLVNEGFSEEKIKTATVVCTDAAYDAGKAPDFWWKKTPYTDFEFPWGKAR